MAEAEDARPEDERAKSPPEGRYANYFEVGYNAFEFVLDFGQFYPEQGAAQFQVRIVTGPRYAKALCELLTTSIARYEQMFGTLPEE